MRKFIRSFFIDPELEKKAHRVADEAERTIKDAQKTLKTANAVLRKANPGQVISALVMIIFLAGFMVGKSSLDDKREM